MKAVIMAGGEGTRLRPLTENTPKPLVRLCGRPVLDYIFDWLEKNSIQECVLALGSRAAQIREYCASHPRALRVSFSEEPYPLGTAGCVRLALGQAEPALILSGDALCDFPLRRLAREHGQSGAAVTVLTARAGDPREYGLVETDAQGRVTGFVEKPSYAQAVGERVNTGIYLLSAEAVKRLPERGDFAADFFPALLREGLPMRACSPKGYWRDIGGPESYRQAHRDLLDGLVWPVASRPAPAGAFTLRPPVWFGRDVKIGDGAVIGPWTVLDDGCTVGAGAEVSGSVLLPGARLGPNAAARESVLCAGASVRAGARLSGCMVGECALIGKNARIGVGVAVAGRGIVPEGESLLEAGDSRPSFDDEGLCGLIGTELTPELAVRAGCAVGSVAKRVGVACTGGPACRVLADALIAGLRSAGADVMDFGETFGAAFRFGMRHSALAAGIQIGGGERAAIRLYGAAGLPAGRGMEREVEQRLARGMFDRAKGGDFGGRMDLSGIGVIYATELLRQAPGGLEGMRATVFCENPGPERMLAATLTRLGCDDGGIRLTLSPDGTRLAMEQDGVRLDWRRTVAAYGQILFARGEDLAVGNDFPRALDVFARRWGRKVYRYLLCPADDGDAQGRALASRQCAADGLMLAVTLLSDMKKRGRSFPELEREIPQFAVREEDVNLTVPPGKLLERLGGETAGEGLLLTDDARGTVLVRSRKNGRALKLFAEAASWELAEELCADTARRLLRLMRRD